MMNFEVRKSIEFKKLLYYKVTVEMDLLSQIEINITSFLERKNIPKAKVVISSVKNAVDAIRSGVIDYEYIMPVSQKFEEEGDFKYLETFEMRNVLEVSIEGDFIKNDELSQLIDEYLATNQMIVSGVAYYKMNVDKCAEDFISMEIYLPLK
ncbi:hypothetical protein M2150_001816 [Lachnospiraceae bacterium PM6-15]|uniref:hypothetical protein n=1 Tax=Ohessyouella blattaphilus TaxID=2949333 RepID=UPI003E1C6841